MIAVLFFSTTVKCIKKNAVLISGEKGRNAVSVENETTQKPVRSGNDTHLYWQMPGTQIKNKSVLTNYRAETELSHQGDN